MYSVIIGIVVASSTFFLALQALGSFRFGPILAVFIGALAGLAVYFAIGIYVSRKLQAMMPEVEAALSRGQPDLAIEVLERARRLTRWQLMIDKAIDGQIGIILYAYKNEPEKAKPYLEKALPNNWMAKAMLGAYHFQRRDDEAMQAAFEGALRQSRKESMLWSTYAWCEWKRGRAKEALAVLERAAAAMPEDERVARNLSALRHEKKMKMNAYEPEWYVLRLQRPPTQVVTGRPAGAVMAGGRMAGGRRYRGR